MGHYWRLFKSNMILLQKKAVLLGMFHAISTFFSSFLIFTPLFETRGVMAAIGAHSAWNLLVGGWPDSSLHSFLFDILKILSFFWSAKMIFDAPDDADTSTLVQKLTPRQPSRMD